MDARTIAAYRPICLQLPGGEILDRYTDEQAAAICNGVGAQWMDDRLPRLSDLLNHVFPWAIAASIIHDLSYYEGQGGDSGRAAADYNFWGGCVQMIDECSSYPWTLWWRRRKAWGLYIELRKYGWLAWGGK